MSATDPITPEFLRRRLSAITPRTVDRGDRRAAAVVVAVGAIGAVSGEVGFLLTKRPSRMRAHPGQFALPGGSVDAGETAEEAALRELHEELGIAAGPDRILGRLDDYVTRSGFVITPFVAWVGEDVGRTVPNPAEVAEVFVPTMTELDAEPRFVTIPESDKPVVQWPFRGYLVHAPTGAIVYQFREIVLYGRHTAIDGLEQPVFAWR